MDDKTRVFVCLFDGQQFEKFSTKDKASGKIVTCYSIDGVRVEEAEWAGRQQGAITRDLAKLFSENLHPELSTAQRNAARAIWDALVFAPSRSAADTACCQLINAPPPIQEAVICEMAETLRDNPKMQFKKNPFHR